MCMSSRFFFSLRNGTVYNISYTGQTVSDFVNFVKEGWKKISPQEFPEVPEMPQVESLQQEFEISMEDPKSEEESGDDIIDIPGIFSFKIGSTRYYFSKNEIIQGSLVGVLLFALGFLMGRITAPPIVLRIKTE